MEKNDLLLTLDKTKYARNQEEYDLFEKAYRLLFDEHGANLSEGDLARLALMLDEDADTDTMEALIKLLEYYGVNKVSRILAQYGRALTKQAHIYAKRLCNGVVFSGSEGRKNLKLQLASAQEEDAAAIKEILQEMLGNKNLMSRVSAEEYSDLNELVK